MLYKAYKRHIFVCFSYFADTWTAAFCTGAKVIVRVMDVSVPLSHMPQTCSRGQSSFLGGFCSLNAHGDIKLTKDLKLLL